MTEPESDDGVPVSDIPVAPGAPDPTGAADPPGDAPVRYRAARRQSAMALAVLALWGVMAATWRPGDSRMIFVGMAGWLPYLLMWGGWSGITLRPEGLEVRRVLRRRVAWDEVCAVRVVRRGRARTLQVRLTDGRVLKPILPSDAPLSRDPAFDAKAAEVKAWWRRYGTPADDGGDRPAELPPGGETLRPGGPRSALIWLVPLVVAGWVTGGAVTDDSHGRPVPDAPLIVTATALVLLAVAVLLQRRAGVRLTPTHLRIRGPRGRTVAWPDVTGIEVRGTAPRIRVVLHTRDGAEVSPPAPRTGALLWDAAFEDKLRTLVAVWRAYRGPDVPEDPADDGLPAKYRSREPYHGPRVWQQLATGMLLAVLTIAVLEAALVDALIWLT